MNFKEQREKRQKELDNFKLEQLEKKRTAELEKKANKQLALKKAKEQNINSLEVSGEAIITNAIIDQVASLAAIGVSISKISEELNISRKTVQNTIETVECKKAVREIGETAVTLAKSRLRQKLPALVDDILDALQYQIKHKKSVPAIALGLKVLGVENMESNQGDTNIQVVLPGQTQTITIPSNKRNNEDSSNGDTF